MSIEDTIFRILNARARGLDDRSTADEAGLPVFIATRYEKITKMAIRDAISNGAATLEEISRKVHLSSAAVRIFMRQYGIHWTEKETASHKQDDAPKGIELGENLSRPVNWRQVRADQIRRAISSGASDLDEIARIVGLAPATVRGYAYENRIKLPHVEKKKSVNHAEKIREAMNSGAKDLDEIARIVGLAPGTVKSYAYQNGVKHNF